MSKKCHILIKESLLDIEKEKGIFIPTMKRIINKHRLSYIPELEVDDSIFTTRYPGNCSMNNCTGSCCKWGVFADVSEKENIIKNAGLIQNYLEENQEHDPSKWFESEIHDDIDFPSGKSVGTQATDRGCVFLNSNGLCVLQKAAMTEGLHPFSLKPFYCVAYPLVIDHHHLMIDNLEIENKPNCCATELNGPKTIIDICSMELEFMLGEEGLRELTELSGRFNSTDENRDI